MAQPRNAVLRLDRRNAFVRDNIGDLVTLGRSQGILPEPPANVRRRGQDAINNWYMTRANQFTVRVGEDELSSGRLRRTDDGELDTAGSITGAPTSAVEPNRGDGAIRVGIPSYAREREDVATPGRGRAGGQRQRRDTQTEYQARNTRARNLGFTGYNQQRRAGDRGYPATTQGAAAYRRELAAARRAGRSARRFEDLTN